MNEDNNLATYRRIVSGIRDNSLRISDVFTTHVVTFDGKRVTSKGINEIIELIKSFEERYGVGKKPDEFTGPMINTIMHKYRDELVVFNTTTGEITPTENAVFTLKK